MSGIYYIDVTNAQLLSSSTHFHSKRKTAKQEGKIENQNVADTTYELASNIYDTEPEFDSDQNDYDNLSAPQNEGTSDYATLNLS